MRATAFSAQNKYRIQARRCFSGVLGMKRDTAGRFASSIIVKTATRRNGKGISSQSVYHLGSQTVLPGGHGFSEVKLGRARQTGARQGGGKRHESTILEQPDSRDWCPYTPGEQPKDRTFIKLNTNENPPPSPGCWRPSGGRRISACGSILIRSLPRCGGRWRSTMAWSRSRCSAATAQTRCWGCAFYALFSPGRKVVFPDITYSFYPVYTELFGLDYEEIPSTRTSPCRWSAF